jgi:DNA-binding CsgD family transcriptional regulator
MTIIDRPTGIAELTLLEEAVSAITGADSAQDLCKRLVHADFAQGGIKGAHIYSIDARSTLVELAGYGSPFASPDSEFVIWDEHPISDCVRNKKLVCKDDKNQTLVCLPLVSSGVPTGALVVVCPPAIKMPTISDDAVPLLSKLGGYFLSTSGTAMSRGPSLNSPTVALEEITTRQVSILGLMADGLTNAEIAAKVLLSESTVRQETIRIYRALAVNGRLEAVAKARALGLVSKVAPPPQVLAR